MTLENRRRFITMSLAAAAAGGLAGVAVAQSQDSNGAKQSAPTTPLYLVVYRRGPKWVEGRPIREQAGLREHFDYYLNMHRSGKLRDAGGFTDESGGAAVFEAADDAAAAAFVAADPAVVRGTFLYELKRWRPNPWEEISKRRAARGE